MVAALPKAAWGITKAIEKRAKRNADKIRQKYLEDVRKGKNPKWAGEKFRCAVM